VAILSRAYATIVSRARARTLVHTRTCTTVAQETGKTRVVRVTAAASGAGRKKHSPHLRAVGVSSDDTTRTGAFR